MKVKIIKPHHVYKGTVDVEEERAAYLISMGIAEAIGEKKEGKAAPEKVEHKGEKEKVETRPGATVKGKDITANSKKTK